MCQFCAFLKNPIDYTEHNEPDKVLCSYVTKILFSARLIALATYMERCLPRGGARPRFD